MRLVQLAGQFGQPREEVAVFERDAEQLVELRGHQDQGRAGHVADQHGLGEEIGDRADLGAGAQQQQQAAEHGHRGGQHGGAGGIAAASGAMALAISSEIAMSGPTITCRELPKNGYTSSGTSAA